MESKYKIVIDTKGADKGAEVIVKGAIMALKEHSSLSVVLTGDKSFIEEKCTELNADFERIEIIDAPEEITNYDNPVSAIFEKSSSSMVKALDALAKRDDICGLITSGNTGALIAGSIRFLSGKDRIRPALAAVLPAEDGSFTCIVDTGATVDCSAAMLVQFAHLGNKFMRTMYAIDTPRIGLLSNGAEPTKGNAVVKETHALLKDDTSLNFVGNIEGNRALCGDCDVLVCDGFAGNQVLKVSEGMAKRMIKDVFKYAKQTGNQEILKLGQHLLGMYDLTSLGGAIILGVEKPVIKAHGCCDEISVVSISKMILNMAQNKAVFYNKNN